MLYRIFANTPGLSGWHYGVEFKNGVSLPVPRNTAELFVANFNARIEAYDPVAEGLKAEVLATGDGADLLPPEGGPLTADMKAMQDDPPLEPSEGEPSSPGGDTPATDEPVPDDGAPAPEDDDAPAPAPTPKSKQATKKK